MTNLPALDADPIASLNPWAHYDPGTMRMLDPFFTSTEPNGQNNQILGSSPDGQTETQIVVNLPGTNTIRVGCSPYIEGYGGYLTEEGYHPGLRQSYQYLIDAGCDLLFLHADAVNSSAAAAGVEDGTDDEKVNSLTTIVMERCRRGFRLLRKVLEEDHVLRAAAIGMELYNEPAIYNIYKGQMSSHPVYGQKGFFEHLYADHCIAVIKEIKEWWSGQIQVPLFRYNASAMDLTVKKNGVSALDRLRRAVGPDQLVWSIHTYPSWVIPASNSYVEVQGAMRKITAPLGKDRICITETNANTTSLGGRPATLVQTPYFLEGFLWWRRNGAGVGYFPSHNTGSSCPFQVSANGDLRLIHMWAYAELVRWFNARNEIGLTEPVLLPMNVTADHGDLEGLSFGTTVAGEVNINILASRGTASGIAGAFNLLFGNLINGGDTLSAAQNTRNFLCAYIGDNTFVLRGTVDVAHGGNGFDTFNLNGQIASLEVGMGPGVVNVNSGIAYIHTGNDECVMNFAATEMTHEIRDLKATDTINLEAWTSPVSVTLVSGNTEITSGSNKIICFGRSVAFVTPRIIGASVG